MDIFINNKKHVFEQELVLSQLLKELQMDSQKGLAVAINNRVVSKSSWDTHALQHEDKLTIIKATQGG